MPVYSWKGLGVSGHVLRGKLFARSLVDLEKTLLKKEIGLIQARPLASARIRWQEKMQFYSHLHTLLAAHIPLHKALTIMAVSAKKRLKAIITDCAALIAEGIPLSEALKLHGLSDEITHALITVGEKTGALTPMVKELVDHLVTVHDFKEKIRAATRGPFITFVLFLVILVGIFVGLIPRFESYFSADGASFSFLTRALFAISLFLRSWDVVYGVGGCFIVGFFLQWFLKGKILLLQKLAFGGTFFRTRAQLRFYTALGVLLKNGVPLRSALRIIENTLDADFLKKEVTKITAAVEAGKPLSAAVDQGLYSSLDIQEFLKIGESSNSVVAMLCHISESTRQQIYSTLTFVTVLIQPLLLIILGLLIAGLMYAISIPLLSLSMIIS